MLGFYDGRGKRRRELASASAYICHSVHHGAVLAQANRHVKAICAAMRNLC